MKTCLLVLALCLSSALSANGDPPHVDAWKYSQAQRSGNRFYAWSCVLGGAAVIGATAAWLSTDAWWPKDQPLLTGLAASQAGIFGLGMGALVGRIGKDAILKAGVRPSAGAPAPGIHLVLSY